MRILVVAPQPFFTPRGTPFSVYHRTRIVCALGHDVDLLTYGQGEDVDIERCRIVRTPGLRLLGPVRIGPSVHKLVLDFFMVFWTVGLLLRHRYDAVHAHEEAVFWCRWLKPVFRFRLIYDMHSSLPQQLHNFEYTKLRSIHWVFETLEKSALAAADAIIVICPALREYARSLANPDKIVMIENSLFDVVRFAGTAGSANDDGPGIPQATRDWLSARDPNRIIAYAGTLEVYQGIDRLIEAFTQVVEKWPDAGLLIVGGGPREVESYRSLADRFKLGDSIHFAGQVSQPDAHELVSHAVVSVSPRIAGTNTPMKIYHLMASGIPIVATRIESHTQVLNDEISIFTELEPAAMAESIDRVLKDPEGARAAGRRAQAWYHENYSEDKYTAKTRRLLALVG